MHYLEFEKPLAEIEGKAEELRAMAHGEDAVLNMEPSAIILRPSVVFGPEDEFFNRFAGLMGIAPIMPVFASKTKFQPIYVGDVAAAIKAAINGKARPGTIYELGGPQTITMHEIHNDIKDITGLKTTLIPLPLWIARIIAFFTMILPKAPITFDQIKLLKKDNVVSQEAVEDNRTLQNISPVSPRTMKAIVPQYLDRFETSEHAFKNSHRS